MREVFLVDSPMLVEGTLRGMWEIHVWPSRLQDRAPG
jgi:hypothetical protein